MFEHLAKPIFKKLKNDYKNSETAGLAYACSLAKQAGLFKACLPKAYGGQDLALANNADYQNAFVHMRALGYANPSFGRIFEGHFNAVQLIDCYANPELKHKIFTALANNQLVGVWATNGDKPLQAQQRGQSQYILDGNKIYASGADLLDFAIITIEKTSQTGLMLAIIDVKNKARAQIKHWQASGMRATASGEYDFSNIVISEQDFIGVADDYFKEPYFDGGVWRYCAIQLGCAEAIINDWQIMLQQRNRVRDPIQIARLGKAKIAALSCAASLSQAIRQIEQSANQISVETTNLGVAAALSARKITENSCLYILNLCEKALGVQAFLTSYEIEQRRRDLGLFLRQAAPDQKLQKAAEILLQAPDLWLW
ncbi:acyl-CoA dehydrogenase family protein [Bartonella sp. TP]|uniref:acyl-CoA dehydrogenase family protein n=1 Tax=Bartonella sp. TP TaxID=3057550 RepID=UPI0025AF8344|nr:acyl-CoA dehydrogenase family protein [Bartonella sp. TP]WJW80160.1 acyl-CoA dehydrogenase family protein [Bartonella sp. TP]